MSNNVLLLIARILLAVIFILSGINKFGNIAGTAGYIGSVGLPAATLLAWLAAVTEMVAGIAFLAIFSVFTGVMFHYAPADQMQMIMFMKNLAIAGGFLALAISGAGSISVDARRTA